MLVVFPIIRNNSPCIENVYTHSTNRHTIKHICKKGRFIYAVFFAISSVFLEQGYFITRLFLYFYKWIYYYNISSLYQCQGGRERGNDWKFCWTTRSFMNTFCYSFSLCLWLLKWINYNWVAQTSRVQTFLPLIYRKRWFSLS